jgi:hypothetical protein
MTATASWHGLADPFDPVEALRHSAAYLRELVDLFGNLGLAAATYNAGPGRVSAWLATRRALPAETRSYVALVTGWTADEWASSSPPTRYILHRPCQSDPLPEARKAAHRRLRTALGPFNWQLICLRARPGRSIVTD